MKASGQQPKNHMKDNLASIREAQRKNREKATIEATNSHDERFRLKQFEDAPSKVAVELRRKKEEQRDSPPKDEQKFLKAHVREDSLEQQAKERAVPKERV